MSKKSTSISQPQFQYLFLQHRHEINSDLLNPNKVGLFEGSFFGVVGWVSLTLAFIFQEELI